jgi:RNA polymerase sigma-70 factor (ECF subfamily)
LDQEELRQLALRELDAVYRLAYFLCNQAQEADDAVQETYLRAFKAGAEFKLNERGIRPWLFKILHNVITARATKAHRQPALVSDFDHTVGDDNFDKETPVTEVSKIDWETVDERMKNAIADLPLSYRSVFLLCAVEELKYREIAEVTGLPVGTVMTQMYRARGALAVRLANLAAERGLSRHKKPETKEIDPPAG